jgi:hypothetical protein
MLVFQRSFQNIAPAIVPVIIVARKAASIAFKPSLDRSACLLGAITPMPPICMAIELKLANPQRA